MASTYFFYDLETSGLSGRDARIMQFAGIRTTPELEPIGEPYNILVKLNEDTLPSPEAIMVTGITPQQTQADGLTEAEFAKFLYEEIFTPDTVTIGFNNVRFDDEFIRHLFWRNFYDPYEWSWKDGRSRWDLLDATRMTRALRPEGIEWPFDKDGRAVNKLELITKLNGLEHTKAHDALSDVEALISVTKLIKEKQPELFGYLFAMRDKKAVQQLVNLDDKKPFVYVSGRYDAEFNKATVAFPLTSGKNGNVVVYDLRYDPAPFLEMNVEEIKAKLFATWEERQEDGFMKIPVKELQYNRCPAVAPTGVLEKHDGWEKISLGLETIEKHKKTLLAAPHFAENIRSVFQAERAFVTANDPEGQLYDSFVGDKDRIRIEAVRNATPSELADFHPTFDDDRLPGLLLHYKARSFPGILSEDEARAWEEWRAGKVKAQLPQFIASLRKLATNAKTEQEQFVLSELQLWAESIVPFDEG
jgi:exodeoxyribonuclease I